MKAKGKRKCAALLSMGIRVYTSLETPHNLTHKNMIESKERTNFLGLYSSPLFN